MIHTSKPGGWTDVDWAWYQTEWLPEATHAACGRLFAKHLPIAAVNWNGYGATIDAAVQGLGEKIWDSWRDGMSWREAAERSQVPIPVAMVWAIDGRVRRIWLGRNGKEGAA